MPELYGTFVVIISMRHVLFVHCFHRLEVIKVHKEKVCFRRAALFGMYLLKYTKLLKPTGHVMHQQFNIQQLYALPTLYLCVLYLSENKQRLVQLTA